MTSVSINNVALGAGIRHWGDRSVAATCGERSNVRSTYTTLSNCRRNRDRRDGNDDRAADNDISSAADPFHLAVPRSIPVSGTPARSA